MLSECKTATLYGTPTMRHFTIWLSPSRLILHRTSKPGWSCSCTDVVELFSCFYLGQYFTPAAFVKVVQQLKSDWCNVHAFSGFRSLCWPKTHSNAVRQLHETSLWRGNVRQQFFTPLLDNPSPQDHDKITATVFSIITRWKCTYSWHRSLASNSEM